MPAPARPPTVTTLSHQYTIATPSDSNALPVYVSTWQRIREQVAGCRRGVGFWATLFPTFFGIVLSCIVPVYLDIAEQHKAGKLAITPWMLVGALSIVVTLLSYKAYRDTMRHEAQSVQSIVDEMDELQSRFTRTP